MNKCLAIIIVAPCWHFILQVERIVLGSGPNALRGRARQYLPPLQAAPLNYIAFGDFLCCCMRIYSRLHARRLYVVESTEPWHVSLAVRTVKATRVQRDVQGPHFRNWPMAQLSQSRPLPRTAAVHNSGRCVHSETAGSGANTTPRSKLACTTGAYRRICTLGLSVFYAIHRTIT
jgi:hypothetical protein